MMGSGISVEGDVSKGPRQTPRPAQTTPTHLTSLATAHNKLALQLYQELVKDSKRSGNIVLGSISVSLGLGLLCVGATGHTLDDLHRVLHLQEVPKEHLLPAFAAMHWEILRSTFAKGSIYEVALKVFAQPEICLTPHYEDLCMHYQISRLKQADFHNRPDLARKNINQWANDETSGFIKDVVPMGIIDRDTKILVLSSMYLRTQWLHPFESRKNYDGQFYLSMKETPKVRMMCLTKRLRYCQSSKGDCEVLELPFSNKYTRLLVLLPCKVDGLSKLEGKLDRKLLDSINSNLNEELIEFHLPKYRYELGITLDESLQKLGARNVFVQGKADFSRITSNARDLHVSKIFHHVYMEFDEGEPREAASGSTASKRSGSTTEEAHCSTDHPTKVMRCDHPFIFMIRDGRMGAIYFIGRVIRPVIAI